MQRQVKEYEEDYFDKKNQHTEIEVNLTNDILSYLIKKMTNLELSGNFLELGCGIGNFGNVLSKEVNIRITGLDISKKSIEKLNQKRTKKYHGIVGDAEDIRLFNNDTFDGMFCFNTLHHFPRLDSIFKNIDFWMKPGGYILIFEPNGNNPVNRMGKITRRLIEIVLGKRYIMEHDIGTPNEVDHTLSYYKKIFKSNSLELIEMESPHFPTREMTVKNLLYMMTARYLPKPLNSSDIFMIVKKPENK